MRNTWVAQILVIAALASIPVIAEANSGDFSGAVAIGTSYAGVNTAPSNGLLVQGNVGIGTASPAGTLDVEGGTATSGNNGTNVNIVAQTGSGTNKNGGSINFNVGAATGTGNPGALNVNGISGTNTELVNLNNGFEIINDRGDGCCAALWQLDNGYATHFYTYGSGTFQIHKYGTGSAGGPVFTIQNNGYFGLGLGVITTANFLAASPPQYNAGSASQTGTTVTGVGTSWTSALIGSQLIYGNGTSSGTITAVASSTSLTATTSQTISPTQGYSINYTGLQIGTTGKVGIGTTSPAYLLHIYSPITGAVAELQNSSGACTHTPGASSETVTCSSDERLKSDIDDTESALAWVDSIRIRDFKVKATGEHKTGVVAQELNVNQPDMVHAN